MSRFIQVVFIDKKRWKKPRRTVVELPGKGRGDSVDIVRAINIARIKIKHNL